MVFSDAAGNRARTKTGPDGSAQPPQSFVPESADVSATGYESQHVRSAAGATTVHLRALAQIGTVTVATGSPEYLHGLPFAGAALNRVAIAAAPETTSDALLRELPGSDRTRSNSEFTNYGQLRLSLNAAGTDRAVALADGFPAQDGFGGQIDWAAFPVAQLTRMEVLRDGASALYGSGAIGGVLDLRTAAPPTGRDAVRADASLAAGTNGAFDAAFSTSANPAGTAGFWAGAAIKRDSYFALAPAFSSRIDHASVFTALTTAIKVRFGKAAHVWQAGVRDANDAQDEGRPNYAQTRVLRQFDVRYAATGGRLALDAGAFARQSVVENLADRFPTTPGALRYRQYVPSSESGVLAQLTTGAFTARADFRAVHGSSDQYGPGGALQSSGSGTQHLAGLALQGVLRTTHAELVAGIRADAVTFESGRMNGVPVLARTDRALSPRIALRYDLTRTLALRASASGAFRAPYLNELVRGYAIGATQYLPDPALLPERSRSIAAGADFVSGTTRLTYDVTRTNVNDAIAFVTIDATHQRRANVARTRSFTQTLTFEHALGSCGDISASASANNARVAAGPAADIGKQLAYVPQFSANVTARWGGPHTSAALSLSYVGQTFADDLNTQPLGSALLAGGRFERRISSGSSVWIAVENVLNAHYLSSNDRFGPPASLRIGITLPAGARTAFSARCPAAARDQ